MRMAVSQTEADWKCIATTVKRGAAIGSGATILCGVVIGERATVGAGSVVTKDVPDGATCRRQPGAAASPSPRLLTLWRPCKFPSLTCAFSTSR